MIYDCFTFFNELDLLEIRLNILDNVVDKFVLVEMNKTFTGVKKTFYFDENKERYAKFLDKIIHIKLDDVPKNDSIVDDEGNKWLLQNYQRDSIMQGLINAEPTDVILISDLDEIPKPEIVKSYKVGSGIWHLEQVLTYYFINNICMTHPVWLGGTRIGTYENLLNPQQEIPSHEKKYCQYSEKGLPNYFRFCTGKRIENAGWHFSYLGGVEAIIKKRESITGQNLNTPENTSAESVLHAIKTGRDIYGRDIYYQAIPLDSSFPQYILDNQEKYTHLILKKNRYQLPVAQINDPRRYFIDWIDKNSSVLDIGCADGDFAYSLYREKNCKIYGMEYDDNSIQNAKETNAFENIYQVDLNKLNIDDYKEFTSSFDYICFGDVLEHLLNPEEVLLKLKQLLKPNGHILISLPNIAHASIKASLLQNNFEYSDTGILDRTHIKFYTYSSIATLLEKMNLEIVDYKFTDWIEIDPESEQYRKLHPKIKQEILNDEHSYVVQYVVKVKCSKKENLYKHNVDLFEKYTVVKKIEEISEIKKIAVKLVCCVTPVKKWRKKLRKKYLSNL